MSSKRKRSGTSQSKPPASVPAVETPVAAPQPITKPANRPLLPPVILDGKDSKAVNLQVVAGSYEKVLHGFIASIPVSTFSSSPMILGNSTEEEGQTTEPAIQQDVTLTTTFSDTFLFTAHTAPLRCVAISSPSTSKSNSKSSKRILATGSPDERVNLYTLSTSISTTPPPSALSQSTSKSTTSNKHLGTLHEHTDTPTALLFTPNRTKLITAGEDSQILIFRTRDWSLLSTLKAPKPKATHSTAGIGLLGNGERPGGINDIALHPSQKILLSVSKGERALRMWNLMTGRKAGALGFTREVMGTALGTKIGGPGGEGKKVKWSPSGEEFSVAFERGVVVFGMDSQPKLRILPSPISKVHQIQYVTLPGDDANILAVSTEDGRIIFYSTNAPDKISDLATAGDAESTEPTSKESKENASADASDSDIDNPVVLGQLGGREMGMVGRVKDFIILNVDLPSDEQPANETGDKKRALVAVSAGSDGVIRIWNVDSERIKEGLRVVNSSAEPPSKRVKAAEPAQAVAAVASQRKAPQVGSLVGIYETGRRVTCLSAMAMDEGWSVPDEEEEEDDEEDGSDTSDEE